jgi:hypothetical protein
VQLHSKIGRRRDQADDAASKHGSLKRNHLKRRKTNVSDQEDYWPSTTTPQAITPPRATTPPRAEQKQKRRIKACASSLCEGPITIEDDEVVRDETNPSQHTIFLFSDNESGFVSPDISTGRDGLGLDTKTSSDDSSSAGSESFQDELESAAKAIREQKAVKSDDTEIPLHLWEERLFVTTPKWAKQRNRFRTACQVLKNGMLRFWKNLAHWLDEKYPEVLLEAPSASELVRQMPPHGRGYVRWRCFDLKSETDKNRSPLLTGEVTQRYMWKR